MTRGVSRGMPRRFHNSSPQTQRAGHFLANSSPQVAGRGAGCGVGCGRRVGARYLVRMHPSNERIMSILREAGIDSHVQVLADSTRTAAEAAAALNCEVGAIASSLVFLADGEPILVLTSGAHRVNTEALAGRIGAE